MQLGTELFKRVIVKLLITNKRKSKISLKIDVRYQEKNIEIRYKFPQNLKKENLYLGYKFTAIHMASSGYFIKNNQNHSSNKIVKVILK